MSENPHKYIRQDISHINERTSVDSLISMLENYEDQDRRTLCIRELEKREGNQDKIFKVLENIIVSDEWPAVRANAACVIIRRFPKRGFTVINWVIEHEVLRVDYLQDTLNECLRSIGHELHKSSDSRLRSLLQVMKNKIFNAYIDEVSLLPAEAEALARLWITQLEINIKSQTNVRVKNRHLVLLRVHTTNIKAMSLKYFPFLEDIFINCESNIVNIKDLGFLKFLRYFELSYSIFFSQKEMVEITLVLFNHKNFGSWKELPFSNLRPEEFEQEPFCKIEGLSKIKNIQHFDIKKARIPTYTQSRKTYIKIKKLERIY